MTLVLPTRSWYAAGEPIAVDIGDLGRPANLEVDHLGAVVAAVPVGGSGRLALPDLPPGGYGLRLVDSADTDLLARSAIHVLADEAHARRVLRYGFVTDYRPERDPRGAVDLARRLHLTAVQFYDWAHRHADLVSGGEDYADPLGNRVSLATVRALVEGLRAAGADALGYAAVYGVGNDEWPHWESLALLDATGTAYGLGGFLRIVDPAAPAWLAHFTDDLAAAVQRCGFAGFHLDQYGSPTHARRVDGRPVALAESFTTLVEAVRDRLPQVRLVFNNVNDFPTWATATTRQDACYVEVWSPMVEFADLAALVTRCHALVGDRPVVVAAYLSVYARAPRPLADATARLTMATLFSHGATHLLAGEDGRLLVDPYYVRNHPAEPKTLDLLARWADFLVAHDELLMDPRAVDVTAAYAGDYNDHLDVSYAAAPVSGHARAGVVWRRIVAIGPWLVVHLVNLVGQESCAWDAPHAQPGETGPGLLRLRLPGPVLPTVHVADPDGSGRLEPVPVEADGTHARAVLPALGSWQVILVRPPEGEDDLGVDRGVDGGDAGRTGGGAAVTGP